MSTYPRTFSHIDYDEKAHLRPGAEPDMQMSEPSPPVELHILDDTGAATAKNHDNDNGDDDSDADSAAVSARRCQAMLIARDHTTDFIFSAPSEDSSSISRAIHPLRASWMGVGDKCLWPITSPFSADAACLYIPYPGGVVYLFGELLGNQKLIQTLH